MKKVIAIVGPTASGKTKISIEVAKYFGFEIISGDSVAIKKDLNIGSAKPTALEMSGIKHYLIDEIEASDEYSVYDFQKKARNIIDSNDEIKIICGGTGLYISSVLYNYEFEASRRNFDAEDNYQNLSNQELYELLLSKDKTIDQNKLHPNNRKRVLRAIQIIDETKNNLNKYSKKNEKIYDYYIIYLKMDRNILYERINNRVDQMLQEGLLEEVKSLYEKKIYPKAIGYQEFIPYFEGKITLDDAVEQIKTNSRHLAKRQETWFKNQMDSHFYEVNLNNIDETIKIIIDDLSRWLN